MPWSYHRRRAYRSRSSYKRGAHVDWLTDWLIIISIASQFIERAHYSKSPLRMGPGYEDVRRTYPGNSCANMTSINRSHLSGQKWLGLGLRGSPWDCAQIVVVANGILSKLDLLMSEWMDVWRRYCCNAVDRRWWEGTDSLFHLEASLYPMCVLFLSSAELHLWGKVVRSMITWVLWILSHHHHIRIIMSSTSHHSRCL